MPAWRENQPADVGTTLIELLAYAGDQLSYYQDAVANEAFLETARQRVSVRRHALLVDYPMHDGLSARAFVHLRVREGGGGGLIPAGTAFLSRCEPKLEAHPFEVVIEDQIRYAAMADAGASVFESLEVVAIHEGLNQLELYTWQSARCHLPMGATGCTLMGDVTARLRPGDLLLLEERVGALSGLEADADPTHRQVVRVRSVRPTTDPLSPGQPLTHVVWHPRDALRFALCVSSAADPAVGVARGNVVLADHGRTLP
ncbi:MAG: putative baseplate assembly protein, partial [Planctomycetota bacterium]